MPQIHGGSEGEMMHEGSEDTAQHVAAESVEQASGADVVAACTDIAREAQGLIRDFDLFKGQGNPETIHLTQVAQAHLESLAGILSEEGEGGLPAILRREGFFPRFEKVSDERAAHIRMTLVPEDTNLPGEWLVFEDYTNLAPAVELPDAVALRRAFLDAMQKGRETLAHQGFGSLVSRSELKHMPPESPLVQ